MDMRIKRLLHLPGGSSVVQVRHAFVVVVGMLFMGPACSHGQERTGGQEDDVIPVDAAKRAAIIDAVVAKVDELYVFPDVGKKICEHIRERQAENAYGTIASLQELTQRLMMDMQKASQDRHIGVLVLDERSRALIHETGGDEDDASWEQYIAEGRRTNFGFERVDVLGGNVGYLKLTSFEHPNAAGSIAIGAMSFLANCDGLIVDVRDNLGGRDEMVQLLLSYLFEDPVHFATKIHRTRDRNQQRWTLPYVPGKKLLDVPVYVLVNEWTASGGEAFAYFLKNHLERVTIIGQTTAGAAHMTHGHPVPDLGIVVFVPDGAMTSPVTGTDWEGTGVKPDIEVPADQALRVAHIEALKILLKGETSERWRYEKEWVLKGLEARQSPVTLSEADLKAYAGTYGSRSVLLQDGQLYYQRESGRKHPLTPMGGDMFMLSDLDYVRLRFERDGSGAIKEMIGLYDTGQRDSNKRTGS